MGMIQRKKGQMKIQQMVFMILAVFIFFALVGLFFLRLQLGGVNSGAAQLQKEQTISSLAVIVNMPELSCSSKEEFCLDEDKLNVMAGGFGEDYEEFWPVASVKVYKVYPLFDEVIECPALNCNYYEIFDNKQENIKEYSTYVSICKKVRDSGYVYDKCEIGKLVAGVRINADA